MGCTLWEAEGFVTDDPATGRRCQMERPLPSVGGKLQVLNVAPDSFKEPLVKFQHCEVSVIAVFALFRLVLALKTRQTCK